MRGRIVKRKNLAGTVITVTANDIERGQSGSSTRCPIARAVRRTTGRRNLGVYVNISFYDKHGQPTSEYALPARAASFMSRFDSFNDNVAKLLDPFTFRMGKRL